MLKLALANNSHSTPIGRGNIKKNKGSLKNKKSKSGQSGWVKKVTITNPLVSKIDCERLDKKIFFSFSYSDDNDALEWGGKDSREIFLLDYSDAYSEEQKKIQEIACSFWDVRRTEQAIQSVNGLKKLRNQIVGLARLAPDWYGEGSVVPEQKVVNDLLQVLGAVPYNIVMPEIEVDDEGGVSLRWMAQNNNSSFTLGCRGTGNVVGTLVSLDDANEQSWKLPVTENINLATKLAFPSIDNLVTGA